MFMYIKLIINIDYRSRSYGVTIIKSVELNGDTPNVEFYTLFIYK